MAASKSATLSSSAAGSRGKGGFAHFMLKEIHEQPEIVARLIAGFLSPRGHIHLPGFALAPAFIGKLARITIAASGSSRHAGLAGEFMLERMAGLPVNVDFASQYCYRDPIVQPHELTILISQSGTTVDTLAALRVARRKRSRTLAICNVAGTPLTRQADATLLTLAGREVAIAATKSFTTQLVTLFAFAAWLAQTRRRVGPATRAAIGELRAVPEYLSDILRRADECRQLAAEFQRFDDFIYAGRDIDYPIALEGALKLKEVSYLHAEGYPAGELKHGPTALINEHLPIVLLATHDPRDRESRLRYEKTVANAREFARRGIPLLAVVTAGDRRMRRITPHTVAIPDVPVLLQPILAVVPLQLLAYHIAVMRGRNVDHPRNLSKSVVNE